MVLQVAIDLFGEISYVFDGKYPCSSLMWCYIYIYVDIYKSIQELGGGSLISLC